MNLDSFELEKNEFFLDKILKCLETKIKIINVISKDEIVANNFDAISAIFKIKNYGIKSTIDTGCMFNNDFQISSKQATTTYWIKSSYTIDFG